MGLFEALGYDPVDPEVIEARRWAAEEDRRNAYQPSPDSEPPG